MCRDYLWLSSHFNDRVGQVQKKNICGTVIDSHCYLAQCKVQYWIINNSIPIAACIKKPHLKNITNAFISCNIRDENFVMLLCQLFYQIIRQNIIYYIMTPLLCSKNWGYLNLTNLCTQHSQLKEINIEKKILKQNSTTSNFFIKNLSSKTDT